MGKAVQPIKNEDLELDLLEYLMANDERMYMFYLILRYKNLSISDSLGFFRFSVLPISG